MTSNLLKREHLPGVPLLLSCASVLLMVLPNAGPELAFSRGAVLSGEWWRLFTSQWVHFNMEHLVWDVLLFLILGSIAWHQSRSQFLWTILLCSMALPIWVFVARSEITVFCGLSGLDSALFGLVVISMFWQLRGKGKWLIGMGIFGFICKLCFEVITSTSFFLDSQTASFIPMPDLHLIGFILGALIGLWHLRNVKNHTRCQLERPD